MPDPRRQREFAVDVVRRLRESGFEALWAGGCVRDQLLGLTPKDYDVATTATPDEIRALFGRRRTIAIGASFGVITVLGPHGAGQIEVATFRRDAAYSDGRHPDAVTFTNAEEDAKRRDFTINGLFYDPLANQVIDYVGGQDDLRRGVVRAIGDPRHRFDEDKLRMLRAVRFAATFGFELDAATLAAVQSMAAQVLVVSAERIAAEMRRMLVLPRRKEAVELLHVSGLLAVVLPEARNLALPVPCNAGFQPRGTTQEPSASNDAVSRDQWNETLATLAALTDPTFPLALAVLLHALVDPVGVTMVCRRWRLSNDETARVAWLVGKRPRLEAEANDESQWPTVQRMLVHPGAADLLAWLAADVACGRGSQEALDFCRAKLSLPPDELNPPPLLTGDDLVAQGVPQGRVYRELLNDLRDAQLRGQITSREAALRWVDERLRTRMG